MDNDYSTGTDHLWPRSRDYDVLTIFSRPQDIAQQRLPSDTLDLSISNGSSFNWVVDIGPQVLDYVATLEQINEDGLGNRPVVRRVGEVLILKIARQADSLRGLPHGLSIGFDCLLA